MAPRKAAAKPATKTAAKVPAPKTTAKASAQKKAPAVKPEAPVSAKALKPVQDRFSKTDILNRISEVTNLSRKDVGAVFTELENIIDSHLKKRAVGDFTLPGLLKIVTVKKPATKARKGINPFTGEETIFKAKPASIAVKIRPLKKLKDMAL
jgi:nucleoid DNA-binding protein